MGRIAGFLARGFALAVVFVLPVKADVPVGSASTAPPPRAVAPSTKTAESSGFRDWVLDRLQSFIANRNAQTALKNADAALKREGGSRIVLRLDTDAVREAMAGELRDEARKVLREARIGFAGLAAHDGVVEVRIREAKDRDSALSKLATLAVAGAPGGSGVDIQDTGDGLLRIAPTEAGLAERVRTVRQQAMEVVQRRLDASGLAVFSVQPDGADRIRILLPGVNDPERLSAIFHKRARITFRLVDESMSPAEASQGSPPPGSEILYTLNTKDPLLIKKQVAMEGDEIVDAAPGFDQRSNEPIVTFRFNANGTRHFAQVTQENVGHPFAIVLDNDVLSAPIIREPITGGSGQISGSFTVQDANDIAVMLRSGMLPGSLIVVEQQVVAPEAKAGQ